MKDYTLYHNPKCSKSRDVLKILEDNKVSFEIVEYLKLTPTKSELKELLLKLELPIKDLVRMKESVFSELHLDLDNEDDVLEAISRHPILLERPIVMTKTRAVIGRPPEKVLDFLRLN